MMKDQNLNINTKNMFEIFKSKYPNLNAFIYNQEEDILVWNGQTITKASIALERVAPIFFQMVPEDIFAYLKGGFYYQSAGELSKIKNLIENEMVITEEEEMVLKKFVSSYFTRLIMLSNNKALINSQVGISPDIAAFLEDFRIRKGLIDNCNNNVYHESIGSKIVRTEFQNCLNNLDEKKEESSLSESTTQSLNQGLSLTRKKSNVGSYVFPEQSDIDKRQNLGMAGYSSIILILGTVITIGMYLASILLS